MTNHLTKKFIQQGRCPFYFHAYWTISKGFHYFMQFLFHICSLWQRNLTIFLHGGSSMMKRWHLVSCCMSKQFPFILEIFYSLRFPCFVLIFQILFSVACPSHVLLHSSLALTSLFKPPVSFHLPLHNTIFNFPFLGKASPPPDFSHTLLSTSPVCLYRFSACVLKR